METNIDRIVNNLVEKLKKWETVESIVLVETASCKSIDPYFFISLDVYYHDNLPGEKERKLSFSDAGGFESSVIHKKDRYLVEGIPVRIEYKNVSRINEILRKKEENLIAFRQTGTYMFYRIEKGKILADRNSWISGVKKEIKNIPPHFWKLLISTFTATMEHYLSDMGAASIKNDDLFFLISYSGFMRSLCSVLFANNKEFEPSGRMIYERVKKLPLLPEDFHGRFDSLLRNDPEFPPGRKYEIAELLAKGIVLINENK